MNAARHTIHKTNAKHLAHFDARIPGTPAKALEAFDAMWDAEGITAVKLTTCDCCVVVFGGDEGFITIMAHDALAAANLLRRRVSLPPLGWVRSEASSRCRKLVVA